MICLDVRVKNQDKEQLSENEGDAECAQVSLAGLDGSVDGVHHLQGA